MSHKNILTAVLAVACVALLGATAYTVFSDRRTEETVSSEAEEQTASGQIVYNGKEYEPDPAVKTLLFLGIDQQEKADLSGTPGENGQSDSLNLLVMNTETREAKILQISRDAMVDIDIYSVSGEKIRTEEGQIALQYAYGDGDSQSCRLTADRVSELLYGVEIDDYLSLTLEGMTVATDAVGGVTLTVPEDYTEIDPAFWQGAVVTLNGELAEKYVRTRDIEELDSNSQRMERQAQFMQALIEKLGEMNDTSQYASLYEQLEPYMVTSMTAEQMLETAEYQIDEEMEQVPGEIISKDGHAQFLPDNEKLQELVINMFYKEI
ncbi:hypothetical protein K280104A7_18800 [Candidatus Bariatricus faecipullorum]